MDKNWPVPDAFPQLAGGDIHVWSLPLALPSEAITAASANLSTAEFERAARFHFELHRNRFIAGRGQLRAVLGSYLEQAPAKLQFDYGPQGKPVLANGLAQAGLHFNLAHSGDLALLAVTRHGPVGIDLEQIRPLPDAGELVARFFSARENAMFSSLPAAQQPAAFFNLWTRKEAWLKATGEGIGHLLSQVEVSFLPAQPVQLLRLPASFAPPNSSTEQVADNWSLHDLRPAAGFVAALAIQTEQLRLHCWHWPKHGGGELMKLESRIYKVAQENWKKQFLNVNSGDSEPKQSNQ
jgi:4'-phosphopantetheinyl transferase